MPQDFEAVLLAHLKNQARSKTIQRDSLSRKVEALRTEIGELNLELSITVHEVSMYEQAVIDLQATMAQDLSRAAPMAAAGVKEA